MKKEHILLVLVLVLTGNSPSSDRDTRRLKNFLTDKEFNSYMKGYEKGLDNPSLRTGTRNPKKWF